MGEVTGSDGFSGWSGSAITVGACSVAHNYTNLDPKPRHDPTFNVNYEPEVKFVRATRNHELRVETRVSSQAHLVGIPGRIDRTELKSELSTNFWHRQPKREPGPLPYNENEAQWLNWLVFCHLKVVKFTFLSLSFVPRAKKNERRTKSTLQSLTFLENTTMHWFGETFSKLMIFENPSNSVFAAACRI